MRIQTPQFTYTVGTQQLASYVHNVHTGDVESMTYGNGTPFQYVYNDLDQVTEVKYNGSTRFVYHYTGDGQLYQVEDEALGLTHTYTYDALGRLIYSSTEEITDFYCAVNELHPFREGNGRTQRVFLTQLTENTGYTINFAEMDTDLLMITTIYAAQRVMDLLKRTLRDNTHPK
ncbi:MAG: Fic family protein [Clostridiales bacterium]|nr:Fic family protein [Clostridiales bacterium]